MELHKLDIKKAHEGLKAGDFSAVELFEACLARIKERDGEVNSFVTVTEEEGRAAAEKVDAKIAAGEEIGVLEGLPVGLKDVFCTKGVKTTACSKLLENYVPPVDSVVTKRLRDAGMVLIGKTNTDEFTCGASSETSYFGVTKNPVDLTKVAGGSSGGAAASVADDMCIYGLGTDTGGSIRQPASFCGCVGLKVTYGRVPRSGVISMASSWDTIGPLTKTVWDAAAVMNVIAGSDRADSTTPDVEVPDYTAGLDGDVKGLRIGVPKEYFGDGVDPEVEKLVRAAIADLEAKGAEIKEVSLPMTKYAVAVYYVSTPSEVSANMARYDGIRYGRPADQESDDLVDFFFKTRGEGFGAEMKRRIMMGTYALSAGYYDAYYLKAQKVRTKIIEDFDRVFEEVDVIAGPVSPTPAFGIGEKADDPLAMYLADALAIPASAAGVPSVSVPCGVTGAGLPVGVQFIGPQFREDLVLKVGDAYER